MKRILIIYNPSSSRFSTVKSEVLGQLKKLNGYIIGKFEVKKIGIEKNIENLIKIIEPGDLLISAGGDATGVIAVNAILKSKKDVTLAVLPYGNFNDLSRTLGTKSLSDIIDAKECTSLSKKQTTQNTEGRIHKFYPLEIYVDDRFIRYATCYVTIGMTAEAVKLYDLPRMRKILRTAPGRNVGSYTNLASWYFKNRHKKQFIPDFKLNGVMQHKKTSDYAAVNGKYMARLMKGGDDYKNPHVFHSQTDRLTSFWRLFKLMARSILIRVPGQKTTGDVLEFINPGTVVIQAEGEYQTFRNIKKIEIKKGKQCLKVITN